MKGIINQSEQSTASAFLPSGFFGAKRFILVLFLLLGANFLSIEGWSQQTCWLYINGPNGDLAEACVGEVAHYVAYVHDESNDTYYNCTGPLSVEGGPLNYIDVTGAIHWGSAGMFKVTFSCAYGCENSAILYISGGAVPSPVTGGGTYCTGEAAPISLTYSTKGAIYNLFRNGGYYGNAQGTGGALYWHVTQPGTYTVQGETCSGGNFENVIMPGSASVSFVSPPSILPLQGGGTICEGGTTAISLPSSQSGITYQLQRNDGQVVGSLAGTGGQVTWSNITAPPGNWSYTATASNNACLKTMSGSPSITVSALPGPHNLIGGGTFCPGSSGPTVTLSGSQSGVNYQLRINDTNSGAPVVGNGGSLTWPNQTAVGNYTVVATNANTGCSRPMPGTISVMAKPLPTQYAVGGGGSYCGGNGLSVTLNGSQNGVSYQLKIDGVNSGPPVAGTGSTLVWPAQNTGGTYTVVATDAAACSQIMNNTATITEMASIIISGAEHISSNPIVLSVSTPAGYTYQWKRDGEDIVLDGQSSSLAITIGGSYQVLVNGNGCNILSQPHYVHSKVQRYFNGMVASVRWRTDKPVHLDSASDYTGMYTYHYDDKYQIKEVTWAVPNLALNTFEYAGNTFRISDLTYDPNGNIQSLHRYNGAGIRTNRFTYHYKSNKNILTDITGHVNSYTYNALGQLVGEDKITGEDQYIEYDVSGKVRKVFSDAAKQNLKVEFIYDDRGFRMAKKNMVNNKTTWYIRDAAGNVLSVHEEDDADSTITDIEIPVYGAGKLGTYYPQQQGSTAYEITDHLGNVRALVRGNVTTYMATMEDNGNALLTNPRVAEMQHFQNLFKIEKVDVHMNHTSPVTDGEENPERSAYLFWQEGVSGMDAEDKSIGPGIMLRVNSGDKIDMETWVRFEKKASYNRDADLLLMAQLLGTSFAGSGTFEGAMEATNTFETALGAAGYPNEGTDSQTPFAYLNYILFTEDMTLADAGWKRIPIEAGFDAGQEAVPNMHKRVSFDMPVEVSGTGYIYVWVSNESANTNVWFDDLKVTHEGSFVTQTTDYGVWGDVLREQGTDETKYRFGYQGQYTEKDEETGWNHFELREYDPVISRWLVPDPARQHSSPYLSMGNNPISKIDSDGGFDWYTDQQGNLIYDANVNSQSDVNQIGGGIYIGESFSDGENTYLPGGGILNLETGQFTQTSFIKSFTTSMYGRSLINGYDYQKAIDYLNDKAKATPVGSCAAYVRKALEAGGLSTNGRPNSAKDYNTYLPTLGFKEVPTAKYVPMAGDIVVMQSIGEHIHGHIQMYNGERWISDFTQNGFWPYTVNRPTYQVFR